VLLFEKPGHFFQAFCDFDIERYGHRRRAGWSLVRPNGTERRLIGNCHNRGPQLACHRIVRPTRVNLFRRPLERAYS
jgi:hypothetical protein